MEEHAISSRGKDKIRLGWYWKVDTIRGELGRALGLEDDIGPWEHNALLDEGERNVLDVYFRNNLAPVQFYLGLSSTTLSETQTLANAIEPSQSGYARQLIARNTTDWTAPALDAGDMKTTATQESFVAAATWTPVTELILVSTSGGTSGSVLLTAALSTTRSLVSGDTLQVTLSVKAQ